MPVTRNGCGQQVRATRRNSARRNLFPPGDFAPNVSIASTEIYTTLTGETAVYYPPNPCSPSGTSCVAF